MERKTKTSMFNIILYINYILRSNGAEGEKQNTNEQNKTKIIEFYLSNTNLNSLQIHFRKIKKKLNAVSRSQSSKLSKNITNKLKKGKN